MKLKMISICLGLILTNPIFSQNGKSVVVSPIIGDKLDRIEEEYFRLVPAIENFQEAVFYLNPDSSLNVFVIYKDDGLVKDTFIVNYISLGRLRNYIDYQLNQEIKIDTKIERGKYVNVVTQIDSVRGELLSVDSSTVVVLNLSGVEYKKDYQPPFEVKYIYNKNMKTVMVFNKYNAAKIIYPTVLALGLGITAGIIVKNNTEEKKSDLSDGINFDFTPLLYGMLGTVAGYLIGLGLSEIFPINVVSTTEYNYRFSEDDIDGLRKMSRYK